jgi:hypothetical protein
MNLDLQQMRSYWNCVSTHWTNKCPSDATGVNRHRIPSRAVARELFGRGARTWSDKIRVTRRFNIAARLAAVYDLFLGRVSRREVPRVVYVANREAFREGILELHKQNRREALDRLDETWGKLRAACAPEPLLVERSEFDVERAAD